MRAADRDGGAWFLVAAVVAAALPTTPQQRPGFEATVARVRVDVIVTDSSGRFVGGLGADDFRLFEDDEEREILGVELVDAYGGALEDAPESPARPRSADSRVPLPTTAGQPPGAAADGAALIFLVDLPGMDWRNKARFATAWEDLIETTAQLDSPRAVYMIDQVGRLRELAPLTFEVDQLRAAAVRLHNEPLTRQSMQERLASGSVDMETDIERRARARATVELLTQFCKALAARRGRTALVWITSEIQLTRAGPTVASFSQDLPWNAMAADPLVRERLEDLYRAANSANVSIYTLDPTPMQELRGIGFDVQTGNPDRAIDLEAPSVQYGLNALRDALRNTAAETGGRALIHWANPAEALTAIERDTARFYLLTYANPAPIGDGRYHRLRVEVVDPSFTVRERRGYTDYPVDELEDRLLSGALNLPGTVAGPPLAAQAIQKWSAAGDPILQIAIRLRDATAPPASGGDFELHGLAVRDDGQVADTFEHEVRVARDIPMPPAYVYEWNLPAGAYELNLLLRASAPARMQATSLPVEVPPATDEWASSDLMLVVPDELGHPVPLVGETLSEDQTLGAYVEVVFGQTPVISGDLFSDDGATRIAQFAPAALEQGTDGVFRGSLRMTGFSPSEYHLQVAVTDSSANKHVVFRRRLRILPR